MSSIQLQQSTECSLLGRSNGYAVVRLLVRSCGVSSLRQNVSLFPAVLVKLFSAPIPKLISTCRQAQQPQCLMNVPYVCMRNCLADMMTTAMMATKTRRTGTAHCAAMTDDGHLSPDYRFTSSMLIRQLQTQRHWLSSFFSSFLFFHLFAVFTVCLSVPRRGHVRQCDCLSYGLIHTCKCKPDNRQTLLVSAYK